MAYVIFDLDGTVIDSSHRHATKADGSIDLKHWFDNAKPHMICKDRILPLARSMRALHKAGHIIIVCTARSMQQADLDFLAANNLPYTALLSRAGRFVEPSDPDFAKSYHGFIGDERDDAEMKADLLTKWFAARGLRVGVDCEPIMFDDNLKVVRRMIKMGIHALDATRLNAKMRAA